MARPATSYVCQSCGAVHRKWMGRCEGCGAWNSLVEEATRTTGPGRGNRTRGRPLETFPVEGIGAETPRSPSGVEEFDRVLGGGLVPGACVLIGGDPGIGKSTLVLQAAVGVARRTGLPCLYVSGEEAVDQVRSRAARLSLDAPTLALASATDVGDVIATLEQAPYALAVIDSIQTMHVDGIESAAGTVAQIRAAAQALIGIGKARGTAVLLVGHVTKEGMIAGPRVLEHMVDTVLYLEGDRGHQYRILRTVKNRFGATDEIGVFEMTQKGLGEVPNPSEVFLSGRRGGEGSDVSGSTVFAGIEGTRPLLVEIQALVGPPGPSTPRRAVVGWDSARLAMLIAVLEARAGLDFQGRDVYLNVAGGLRISEPAADLAVAAALVSAQFDRAVPPEAIAFGEIGLSGEVRPVAQPDSRLREAAKLGFRTAWLPERSKLAGEERGIALKRIDHVDRLVDLVRAEAPAARKTTTMSVNMSRA